MVDLSFGQNEQRDVYEVIALAERIKAAATRLEAMKGIKGAHPVLWELSQIVDLDHLRDAAQILEGLAGGTTRLVALAQSNQLAALGEK
jgi:hypothetical protein